MGRAEFISICNECGLIRDGYCGYFDNELSPRDFKSFNHGEITGKEFEETLIKLMKEYKAELEKEKLNRIQEDFL